MGRNLKTSLTHCWALTAALLVILGAGPAVSYAATGKELRIGGQVWHLLADGHLEGQGVPAGLPLLADAAVSPGASILYGLVPQADGRATDLIGLTIPEGQVMTRWPIPGRSRFLAVSRDGDHACVVGLRPRAKGEGPENWTLHVVALEGGRLRGPLSLGFVPHDILLLQTPLHDSLDSRLYVAADDRIATYSISPPISSWFHRSPGANGRLAGTDGSDVILALRGERTLAIFDPSKRQRIEGRVILTDDDATSVIELEGAANDVRLVEGGRAAEVLGPDGAIIMRVDVVGAAVPEPPKPVAPKIDAPKPAILIPETPLPEAPKPDLPKPEAPKIEAPPPPPAPKPDPPAQLPIPVHESPSQGINGRVTGEGATGIHVLLYGPGNILKLKARTVVGADGRFHFPMPPPGAYRMVVSAPPGTSGQIFTTPDFRSVLVGDDTTIVEGLDFKLRGRL